MTLVTCASMVQQVLVGLYPADKSEHGAAGGAGANSSGGAEGGAVPMDVDDGARGDPAPPAADAAPADAAGAARTIT